LQNVFFSGMSDIFAAVHKWNDPLKKRNDWQMITIIIKAYQGLV